VVTAARREEETPLPKKKNATRTSIPKRNKPLKQNYTDNSDNIDNSALLAFPKPFPSDTAASSTTKYQ